MTYCAFLQSFYGQTIRKVAVYLQGHYNKIRYDITGENRPVGLGFWMQILFSNH